MAGSALKSVLRSPRYAGQHPRLIVALASLNDEHELRALHIDPQQAQRLRSNSPVSRNMAHDDKIPSLSSSVPDVDGHDYCGVGLQLLRRFNGDIMVMSVRTDGPAKRSGIHAGAIISAIGETPVQGLEVEDVMDLLYGPAGSIVKVRTTGGESGAGEAGVHVLIRQHAPQTELDLQRLVTASQRIIQASEQPWHNRDLQLYQHLPPQRDSQDLKDVRSITRGLTSFGGGEESGGECRVAGAGSIFAGDGSRGGQCGKGGSRRDLLGNTQLFTTMRSFLDTSWSKKSPPQVNRRADAQERQPHTLRESLSLHHRRVPHASSPRPSRLRLLEPPPKGGEGVGSLSGTILHNSCPGAGAHVCGIGVQLVKCRNGDIVVLAVHKGSAAEKARIEQGDIIVAVDETNVSAQGLNCIEIAGLVSGPEGTLVRLFLRDKEGCDKDILVPRQTAPSVSQEILASAAKAAAEFWNSSTGMGTGSGTGIGGGGGGGARAGGGAGGGDTTSHERKGGAQLHAHPDRTPPESSPRADAREGTGARRRAALVIKDAEIKDANLNSPPPVSGSPKVGHKERVYERDGKPLERDGKTLTPNTKSLQQYAGAKHVSDIRGGVGVEADKNAALPLTMFLELEEQAKNAVRDTKSH